MTVPPSAPPALRRELGVFGATTMGLGSIVGTGVFVSIGIACGLAGPSVVLAIFVAGLVALCNALSSAQLAAQHPTSGGTYEYGHVHLRPWVGFSAGWMFLCAKSASAATAALGFAGYLLEAASVSSSVARVLLAMAAVVVLVAVVLGGLKRSHVVNVVIVGSTLAALGFFVCGGLLQLREVGMANLQPFFDSPLGDGRGVGPRLMEATALMFVAYTGYGRIATMGEEVREPRRTIPRAIVLTLAVSMLLYVTVGLTGIAAAGAAAFLSATTGQAAPLATIAAGFSLPGAGAVLTVGAIAAMLGVLLNLVLGLSRVVLAMARRGDLPQPFARVNAAAGVPSAAVGLVGVLILALVAMGSIRFAWLFSAFTVLVYYGITNLCALRLAPEDRLYPRAFAWAGLLACFGLAFWVEPRAWLTGLGLLGGGLLLRALLRRGR